MRIHAFVLIAAACSDEVALEGIYRVDTSVESEPCGADAPVAAPPAYLKFEHQSIFGQQFYTYEACSDEAGAECRPGLGIFGALSKPIDDGWSGILTSYAGDDQSCVLQYRETAATLRAGSLVVDTSVHRDEDAGGPCTLEEAESRARAMPCVFHAKITATQL